MALTSKELTGMEDLLNIEMVLVKKYRAYASQCDDQNLVTKCNQIADRHQQHFNTLIGQL